MKDLERRFIRAADVASKQRWHFMITTIGPVVICLVWFMLYPAICGIDLGILVAMWILTGGLGVSIGYHRYFTHSAFKAHPLLRYFMAASGSMAAQGPITYWVAVHRCHHRYSDDVLDPHSPRPFANENSFCNRVRAFFHGHMGWVVTHDVPRPIRFARDLTKDPQIRFFDRTYRVWVLLGIAAPGLLMLTFDTSIRGFVRGCVFGGFLRIVLGNQLIWAINSVCHTAGTREFDARDNSANNWLLAIPTFGEGWHNNHHAFQWSARFGLRWWQIDLGWLAIRGFAKMGLASQLKQPTREQIKSFPVQTFGCHPPPAE